MTPPSSAASSAGTPRLRPGVPEDAPEIAAALRSALAAPPWNEDWPEARALDRVREILGMPRAYAAVAEDGNGAMLGYLLAVAQSSAAGFQMRVEEIGVVPMAQRRGIGTALMRRLVEESYRMGADCIWLASAADGPQAAFYASLGLTRNPRGALYGAMLR
ncbi:GNAT family N-acetyltransferase [Indioceanicola profundi]|uniref:GNAT family N-acetyltransferase n=1 Tax=Indioceanicola profundi TaxID=2220096 RepID=UPI000E6AD995|nr:GNAT family N-acetyltransferase [Indioceanicola profundi]